MVVFMVILYSMIGMGYFNWLPGASNWLGNRDAFVALPLEWQPKNKATKEQSYMG